MADRRPHIATRRAAWLAGALLLGCDPAPSAPAPAPAPEPARSYDPNWDAPRDPLGGRWSLEQAMQGLPAEGELVATIRTELGELRCQLWPDRAPVAVANFVGLARGLRPWKTLDGSWQKRPAYDGSQFSRVVAGVLAQGGSPDGTPDRGPGYFFISDESRNDARHDRPGLLCVATSPGTLRGGMQFAITLAPAPHLDEGFTIFGECGPLELVRRIGAVATDRGRPRERLGIEAVRIGRQP